MIAAVQSVECTNCGSTLELIVAVAAVVLALVGVAVSAAQYRMMRREHKQFMREQAGATVDIELRPANRESWDLFEDDIGDIYFRAEVLLMASGTQARDVVVQAVFAEGIPVRWAGPGGEE